jgi:hypothetical protein
VILEVASHLNSDYGSDDLLHPFPTLDNVLVGEVTPWHRHAKPSLLAGPVEREAHCPVGGGDGVRPSPMRPLLPQESPNSQCQTGKPITMPTASVAKT